MIHPNTILNYISPEIGFGVVATKFIPKGPITWVADPLDQIFSPEKLSQLPSAFKEIVDIYSYRDNIGNFILCWDHSRFVNHSFLSNCMSTAYNFELAVRNIFPGEELTDDYGYLNLIEPFDCIQEKGSNRKQALPNDLLNFHQVWDGQLKDAFVFFKKVDQPLLPFIENQYQSTVSEVADNPLVMDSILQCYYSGIKSLNRGLLSSITEKNLIRDKTA